MGSLLILTLFTLACLEESVLAMYDGNPCDKVNFGDGCLRAAGQFMPIFKDHCNTHDLCYVCGSKYKISRSECDKRLLQDLKTECNAKLNGLLVRGRCFFSADSVFWRQKFIMHTYVKSVGESAFCAADTQKACLTGRIKSGRRISMFPFLGLFRRGQSPLPTPAM